LVDPHPLYSWAAASVAYREATRTRDEWVVETLAGPCISIQRSSPIYPCDPIW
jgi:hypothetical protein